MNEKIILHSAQDFALDRMHYGVGQGTEFYILTSDRDLLTPWQCELVGIKVARPWIPTAGFSWDAVMAYVKEGKRAKAAEVYDAVRRYLTDHVVLKDEEESRLLALWTMGTYVHRIFQSYPYLWLHGLGRRCGRSTLMKTLQPIVFNGVLYAGADTATICRLADRAATLLIDDLRGVRKEPRMLAALRSGFCTGYVMPELQRSKDGVSRLRHYSIYSPKVLAGDNAWYEQLWDTAIPIRMVRKGKEDRIKRDLHRVETRARRQKIRDDLFTFGLGYDREIDKLHKNPECLTGIEHLRDRELDLWQPIFVLANLIDLETGSDRVTKAMVVLSRACAERHREAELATCEITQLLVAWKEMMDRGIPSSHRREGDTLYYKTDQVFDYFCKIEEFSWLREPRMLSRKLREIGITSEWRRTSVGRERLYRVPLAEFVELYERVVGDPY